MRVRSVSVRNYRSIAAADVRLDGLTVIIGPNGVGKTSVLKALELFANDAPPVSADDFNDEEKSIVVDLTIAGAAPDGALSPFVIGGEICLRREYELAADRGDSRSRVVQKSYIRTRLNTDFDELRGMTTKAKIVPAIKSLKKKSAAYDRIPECESTAKEWKAEFLRYERDFCLRRPDHASLGSGYVAWDTKVIMPEQLLDIVYIPAMRDITHDGSDGSGSYLSRLINMSIEHAWDTDIEVGRAAAESITTYGRYFDLIVRKLVPQLSSGLNQKSSRFARNAAITVSLGEPGQMLPQPRPFITLHEDGRETDIDRAGGGLQRIYLMALLEAISDQRGKALEQGRASRVRLIMIDEPELYQHPQRQRHILRELIRLTDPPSGMQVLCSTHSQYFIELSQIDGLRLLRKNGSTSVHSTSRRRIMRPILDSYRTPLPEDDALDRWLDINASHWIMEGFFSRLAVLVEGVEDRNVLIAAASVLGVDLNGHEITIIPAHGKHKIFPVANLFVPFGIPVYPIWDLDSGSTDPSNEKTNRGILSLAGSDAGQHAGLEGTAVADGFSCFEENLTAALHGDLVRHRGLLASGRWGALLGPTQADAKKSRHCRTCTCWMSGMHGNLKKVLGSKDAVYDMLREIYDANPEALEAFAVAKIVRRLDSVGEALRAPPRSEVGASSGHAG